MTAQPFRPLAADGRSRARVLVDHLETRQPNDVLLYGEIAVIVGDASMAKDKVQTIVSQAAKVLRREQSRNLVNVQGVGYRIAESREHMDLADRRYVKAQKQIDTGIETLRYTKVNDLTEDQRKRHDASLMVQVGLSAQMGLVYAQQRRQEEALRSLTDEVRKMKGDGDTPLQ